MKLHEVLPNSYIKIIDQIRDNPYSKYNHGDQIDLYDAISQVEVEKQKDLVEVPIGAPEIKVGELLYFSQIDGMYSLCYKVNPDTFEYGEICHIAAWTEVEPVDLQDIFEFDKIRKMIGRSGYGKNGNGKYQQAALKDMSDDWVRASINYVSPDHPHLKYYKMELEYRLQHGIIIKDTEDDID
jgi:hypothetical protein